MPRTRFRDTRRDRQMDGQMDRQGDSSISPQLRLWGYLKGGGDRGGGEPETLVI